MGVCQYEFQFYNEFMGILEREIGKLLGIEIDCRNIIKTDKGKQSFIFRKKDSQNFMLFSANQASYVYLVVIRCEKKYEEGLKKILLKVCNDIEEDYGENHRREVRDVYMEKNNRFIIMEEKFGIRELFNI